MTHLSKHQWLVTIALSLLLAACSTKVPIEFDKAEQSVAAAYRAGAFRSAVEQYQEAQEALQTGRDLVRAGRAEEAHDALLDAIIKGHEAELAAYRHQLDMTEEQLDSAEEYILRLEAQRSRYFDALSSIYDEQKLSEIKINNTKPGYKPVTNYRVRSGENLFAIAARRKIYGDALLWPLIYKANRDQIKDPQQIYPGQVLSSPRDVSEEKKEAARITARDSKIFQQPASNGKKQ